MKFWIKGINICVKNQSNSSELYFAKKYLNIGSIRTYFETKMSNVQSKTADKRKRKTETEEDISHIQPKEVEIFLKNIY